MIMRSAVRTRPLLTRDDEGRIVQPDFVDTLLDAFAEVVLPPTQVVLPPPEDASRLAWARTGAALRRAMRKHSDAA